MLPIQPIEPLLQSKVIPASWASLFFEGSRLIWFLKTLQETLIFLPSKRCHCLSICEKCLIEFSDKLPLLSLESIILSGCFIFYSKQKISGLFKNSIFPVNRGKSCLDWLLWHDKSSLLYPDLVPALPTPSLGQRPQGKAQPRPPSPRRASLSETFDPKDMALHLPSFTFREKENINCWLAIIFLRVIKNITCALITLTLGPWRPRLVTYANSCAV